MIECDHYSVRNWQNHLLGLRTYARDDAFRITGITDTVDSSKSWSYGYDLLDRLTSATRTGLTQGWGYDANGNRLSQTGTAASTYAMSGTSNRLNGVSGALSRSYSYDAAGNATADGTGSLGYDGAGRLTSASEGGNSASYAQNALGQRVRKTVNGVVTIFSYDESGHLLGEYEASGALIREYVWLGDIPVAVITGGPGTPPYVFWYLHTDHLNTPRSVENPTTSELVWRWDSAPFGETAPNEDPDGDLNAFTLPLRFPGQYADAETGLHYNYFRDYEPAIGRYVQSDPIGLRGGINTFAYAGLDPVSSVDTRGQTVSVAGRVGLTVGRVANAGINALLLYWTGTTLGGLVFEMCNEDSEEKRCRKVLQECREKCLNEWLDNPIRPGGWGGSDTPSRLRHCTRECMEAQGCFNY